MFARMKIKKLLAAAVLPALMLAGCATPEPTDPTPREITGVFKYTGATYSPVHFNAPYRYALHDINGGFIAYLDTTKIVLGSTNALIDKVVDVRGTIVKEDGESVMRAESVRIKR